MFPPQLGSRPVRVLTAQNHHRGARFEHDEAVTQARWLALSSDSKQIFAYHSGHYIELDQPQLVIDAIHDEIERTRR